MRLPLEKIALIRHLHKIENLSVNAISARLDIHHSTIKRALAIPLDIRPKDNLTRFPPMLEKYRGTVEKLLDQYPDLKGTRCLELLREQGYDGSINTLRRGINFLKEVDAPRKIPHAKRQVFAGEEAQMDWGSLGKIQFGEFTAKAYLFALVLSWSRDIYARVTLDMKTDTLARAHVYAFQHYQGIPKMILYDNLKQVVIKTEAREVEFNHQFLSFSAEYGFRLQNCNVRQPQEKGRVERAIRYLKDSFFSARHFADLQDCNDQLAFWLVETSRKRRWPDGLKFDVEDRWKKEKPRLIPLPNKMWFPKGSTTCRVRKTPHIHFSKSQYSVPPSLIGKQVQVLYDDESVEIYDGENLMALHQRSYVPGKIVEAREHIMELAKIQNRGSAVTKRNALFRLIPHSEQLFKLRKSRGLGVWGVIKRIYSLADTYGAEKVDEAISEVLQQGALELDQVEAILKRKAKSSSIPLSLLPKGARCVRTKHQSLEQYEDKT